MRSFSRSVYYKRKLRFRSVLRKLVASTNRKTPSSNPSAVTAWVDDVPEKLDQLND